MTGIELIAAHGEDTVPDAIDDEEWRIRIDLAACYRLVSLYEWDDGILNHISARIPGKEDHFLLNPFGLLFEEVTASNLVKIDTDGNKVAPSPHPINRAGFVIHSAIHMARPDIGCVIHLHSRDGVAVSAMRDGILPLDQASISIQDDIAYHDFEGLPLDLNERQRLERDLGTKSRMILRNHGTLAVGSTVGETFMKMYTLERACTVQVRALSAGDRLNTAFPRAIEATKAGVTDASFMANYRNMAWAAFRRKLDRIDPSYRS
jgi:ribulose-5-phosphate 4-epimerase/fuculose-1-phosphate aldolase